VDLVTGEETNGVAGRYRFDHSGETRAFLWQYRSGHPRTRTSGEQAK